MMTDSQSVPQIGLFLETSAQILRLSGSAEIQRGIDELIRSSRRVGTSWFVQQEFEYTYGGLYDYIRRAAGMLPDPHRPRVFTDLIIEIREVLPLYIPGGANLFLALTNSLAGKYGNLLVTPMFLYNAFAGHKQALLKSFLKGEFFDQSSCGVWEARGDCSCSPEPQTSCRLKGVCIDQKDFFIASVQTLASAGREESKWLSQNLKLILSTEGLSLLALVGKHPGHFGDLIIFWEVPDQWTILTRDHTFAILNNSYPRLSGVYKVRLPRRLSGKRCQLQVGDGVTLKAILLDYNAKGARVRIPKTQLEKGEKVILVAKEFAEPREGVIVYRDLADETIYGLKLPMKRSP